MTRPWLSAQYGGGFGHRARTESTGGVPRETTDIGGYGGSSLRGITEELT